MQEIPFNNRHTPRADGTEWALLDRYLAGECSAEERARVDAWLVRTPEAQTLVEELRGVTIFPESERVTFGLDALEHRLMSDIRKTTTHYHPPFVGTKPVAAMRSWAPQWIGHNLARTAAAFAGALAIVTAGVIWGPGVMARVGYTPVQQSFSTTRGQQAEFTLEDGTRVWLAPETQLRYTGGADAPQRTVELIGEAVFTVSHRERSPFLVKAKQTTTRVLGTTFGVKSYPEDTAVRVAIEDGKVAVGTHVLAAGDVILVNNANNESTLLHAQSIPAMLGWRLEEQLAFSDARFDEILPVLSRWDDLEFVLADPRLAERRVTVSFDKERLTTEVLDLLCTSLGARYLRIGRTITFYPQVP